jgi:hypothetical protein
MNTNYLKDDIDWLIYADYLDDQGINHFIREEVLHQDDPSWSFDLHKDYYNFKYTGNVGAGTNDVGIRNDLYDGIGEGIGAEVGGAGLGVGFEK